MSEGRMSITGVAGRFVQGIGRHLRLEASSLRIVAGFARADDGLRETSRIEGDARVSGDSLGRAGFEGSAGTIALVLRPLPAGGEARILLTLGYRDDESGYVAELWGPATLFEALKRDILTGAAEHLSLSATTSLWVREEERDASPALPVSWHLGLEPGGQRSAGARGLVESIDWGNAAESPAEPQPLLAAPAEDELPDDPVSDELRRINWSLKLLLLLLAFLLIIVAMK
ncbi:hypothetical protein DWF00_23905 [Bosea caraganae]|nr:hypothetical protein DWF00_23905 [Bosea caraganae]